MRTIDVLKILLNTAEILACITGFVYWRKLRSSYWKYFPLYLGIIVVCEMAGKYLNYTGHNSLKVGLYNFFVIPLEIFFFVSIFYKEFEKLSVRWLPIAAACIYFVCWLADMFIISKYPNWWFHSFSYTVGILLMLVLILTFLYILATGNDILFIKSNIMFWVCLGLFVFYFCSLPFFGVGNYLFAHYKNIYIGYAHATYILNFIMYSLFTIAFIWGKPKSSSSLA
jgi:hypothetical protein